eukprot:CAMPEP_0181362194 /NCGR_PEP_ID=MMETSP1106-20121128/7828_1 /TAXON_ID=81844 /ORGANISM="Mantoniella antarctica, Strain SL-175" /LENGTH=125 /DNA_ID=CAMNT_0023476035 /DNA_START=189 /DNA_END=567 /DNA_ORIENTATION=+
MLPAADATAMCSCDLLEVRRAVGLRIPAEPLAVAWEVADAPTLKGIAGGNGGGGGGGAVRMRNRSGLQRHVGSRAQTRVSHVRDCLPIEHPPVHVHTNDPSATLLAAVVLEDETKSRPRPSLEGV